MTTDELPIGDYFNQRNAAYIAQLERDLAALRQRHAEAVEAAFRAGYHCNWVKAERRYIFDPEMKPGDPDGAYAAWLASTAKARLT